MPLLLSPSADLSHEALLLIGTTPAAFSDLAADLGRPEEDIRSALLALAGKGIEVRTCRHNDKRSVYVPRGEPWRRAQVAATAYLSVVYPADAA